MKEVLEKISREKSSHKGQNGKIGVIAGSVDYTGAPALVGQSSLRTGGDLVKILTSDHVKDVVAGYSENLIVEGYDSKYFGENSVDKAERLEEWADSMVIGPGISCARQDLLQEFIETIDSPAVIDAEAIQTAVRSDISNVVITPHEGEADLIRQKYGSIEEFVEIKEDVVVLLKGRTDRIYSSEGVDIVETGNAAMTVGGTGDVLAGIVSSLIAQGLEKKEAAKLGAWINGKAGEKASEKFGNGLVATDLLGNIAEIMKK